LVLEPTLPDPKTYEETLRRQLGQRQRQICGYPEFRCSAVLVPLFLDEAGWHVLVTLRTNDVEHHKGQISFPGGACDREDTDIVQTALREMYEEIGVAPQSVEVLGILDDMRTISRFVITPVVGVIPHPYPYRINPGEVEAVVEVPLSFLRKPENLRTQQIELNGRIEEILFWDYGEYTIWGATARILKGLLDLG
jgi:8-oxo-dGTP pyrophosphatase MutT (NUDIX family)